MFQAIQKPEKIGHNRHFSNRGGGGSLICLNQHFFYSNFLEQEEDESKLKILLSALFETVYNRLNKYRGHAAASFFRY